MAADPTGMEHYICFPTDYTFTECYITYDGTTTTVPYSDFSIAENTDTETNLIATAVGSSCICYTYENTPSGVGVKLEDETVISDMTYTEYDAGTGTVWMMDTTSGTTSGGDTSGDTPTEPTTVTAKKTILKSSDDEYLLPYTDVSLVNGLSQQLSEKVDTANFEAVSVVTESYVNGTSWYRIWSDGWCEQGGANLTFTTNVSGGTTITYLKPFADNNYVLLVAKGGHGSAYERSDKGIYNKTNTDFNYRNSGGQNGYSCWMACGYIS